MIGRILINSESLSNLAFVRVLPNNIEVSVIIYNGDKKRTMYPHEGTGITQYICNLLKNGANTVEIRYRTQLTGDEY